MRRLEAVHGALAPLGGAGNANQTGILGGMVSVPAAIRPWQLAASLALILALVGLWCLHRPAAEPAARATFQRIQNAIAERDSAGVITELHPRYEFTAMWPRSFESAESNGLTSDQPENPRVVARRGIAVVFLQSAAALHMDYRIEHIAPQPDGTVGADVTMEVRSTDGGPPMVSGRSSHHFVLAWDGWFLPKLRVLSHDPIEIRP